METSPWIVLGTGFGGAIIGAGASIITQWLQLRAQHKKHVLTEAVRAAVDEYKTVVDIARTQPQYDIYPLPTFILAMVETIKLADKGKLTAEKLKEHIGAQRILSDVYAQMDEEHRAAKSSS